MFCKNCGIQLENGISFCPNCGTAVEAPKQAEQPQYQQPQNNYQQPQNNYQQPQNNYQQPQNNYQQAPYQNQGYEQNQGGYQQNPYGQNPYQQNPYGQNPYQQNPYAQNQYQQPFVPAIPMKWFKFLIYFSLWAGAVLNFISGIILPTGAQYGDSTKIVYLLYSDLKTIDIITGLICIAIAVLGIVTRFSLAGFKQNGPKLLMILYSSVIICNVFYMIGVSSVLPEIIVKELDFSGYISNTVGNAVMMIINYVYFNKRKHLFTR